MTELDPDNPVDGQLRKRHGFWEVYAARTWHHVMPELDPDEMERLRMRHYPLGRKKGDPLHTEHEVAEFRETMRIRIYMMEADLPSHNYEHYAATRYYSASIDPDDHDEADERVHKSIVCEVSKHDFGRAYGGFGGFAEQNMVLEELWFKHGGE